MIRFALAALIPVTGTMLAMANASAQPGLDLRSQIFVERTHSDANGRESRMLSVPGQIARGDRLVFILRYRNAGRAPVGGYAVTNPVPSTLRIDPDQNAMLVSVDGGRTWGRLGTLLLPTPLGGMRRATAEDITHIRWPLFGAVAPGSGGQVSYRATVR